MGKLDIVKNTTFKTVIMSIPYNDSPAEGESYGPAFPEDMDIFMAIRLKKEGQKDLAGVTSLYVLVGWFDATNRTKLLDEDLN